jgi:sugar-specific transcriptional regulator TrmB
MSKESVSRALDEVGLTQKESEVYILLAREGVLKGLDISKRLRMHKAQVYTILKNLQNKGAVETTLESPARFTAVPFENLLDLFIRTKKEQASSMEREKDSLLSSWESVKLAGPTSPVEKFLAVRGANNVSFAISNMVNGAKKELRMMMTSLDIVRAERLDIVEALASRLAKARVVGCRILTYVSKENLGIVKQVMKLSSTKHLDIKWGHVTGEPAALPRIVMKDGEETFILRSEDVAKPPRWDDGLWTNSRFVTDVTGRLFDELWITAIDADERIRQIEVQKSSGKTLTIDDRQAAFKLFNDRVAETSKEITTIIPSMDILTHLGNYSVQELSQKGVAVRVMFPINAGNIKNAISLSRYCNVRDPSIDYLGITLLDRKHVFRFKNTSDGKSKDPLEYFRDMYYTNEQEEVEKITEMLEGLWQRSVEISDIESRLKRRQ